MTLKEQQGKSLRKVERKANSIVSFLETRSLFDSSLHLHLSLESHVFLLKTL